MQTCDIQSQKLLFRVLTALLYTILPPKRRPCTPPGTYDTKKLNSATICIIAENRVNIVECNYNQYKLVQAYTPIEKYSVAAREPKYAAVKGTLVGERRCLIYGTGPCNAAKLPINITLDSREYLHKNSKDPTVHRITNFRGFNTNTGINTNAITKQAAAPRTQHPNTTSLSH